MITRHTITSKQQWLELRQQDVTASDIGALFGDIHPYRTIRSLYEIKTNEESDELPDSDVLRRGRLLEMAVAGAVQEKHPDWKIEKADYYLRDPDLRIGCTTDFVIHCPKRGRGIMQAKTVAPNAFEDNWTETIPPLYTVLQAHTEMMLEQVPWGIVAALVIDPYKLPLYEYNIPRHKPTEAKLAKAVRDFWIAVEDSKPPEFNFARDDNLITGLYPVEEAGKEIDLSLDNRIYELVGQYEELSASAKDTKGRLETIKTELKAKMGDAERAVIAGGRTITWKLRAGYTANVSPARVLRIGKPPKQRN